ncbi:GDP-mannose 4,6-dehydratase, partial [Candidatus Uhrbacteria bacterium]|nr:GDP-mannose 4,6-dehydratase [Candidatus Uhrbacteria bacterium]
YYFTRYYRQAFGMHASAAILYNHESPRRAIEYLSRKVSNGVARIKLGKQRRLALGDTSAKIDWGHAREYMEAAWAMLQQPTADDYVIATGEVHSVQDFVELAFRRAGLDPADHVVQDRSLLRPTKTSTLVGDASKAKATFGFAPKIRLPDLVKAMVEADMALESGRNT